MKTVGVLIIGLILVFAFTGLQDVSANEADEAFETGLKYDKGEGVTKDTAEALKWYRKAADQGHARAQNNIGLIYVGGEGVTQDYTEALKWFQKAADQGYASAQYNTSLLRLG